MVEMIGIPAPTVASCQSRSGIMRMSCSYCGRAPRERPLLESTRYAPPLYAEHVEVEGAPVHGHVHDDPREAWLGLRAEHVFQRLDAELGEGCRLPL